MKFYEKIRPMIIKYGFSYPLTIVGSMISIVAIGFFWVLYPFVKVKVAGMISQRIGHFACNTDLFFRRRQLYGIPRRTFYIFLAGSVCNQQLYTMWKRHLFIVRSRVIRGMYHYSEWLWKKTPFYEPLDWLDNEQYEFHAAQPTLQFNPQETVRGHRFLKQIGLDPKKDWFVCIYARDAQYMKSAFSNKAFGKRDWSYHDYRNADIDTFKLAVQHIVDKGGYVFRMGHHVAKPFGFHHERVIDYALRGRNDFMDVFLMAHCRFVLGTTGGICDLAMIFDTPRICVNTTPPFIPPYSRNCLFIPKKLRRVATGEWVPFKEFILKTCKRNTSMLWYSSALYGEGYEYADNTDREILEVTQEMMARLDGAHQVVAEDQQLLECYWSLFPKDHWAASIRTPVGQCFIRDNATLFDASVKDYTKAEPSLTGL